MTDRHCDICSRSMPNLSAICVSCVLSAHRYMMVRQILGDRITLEQALGTLRRAHQTLKEVAA